MAAVKDVLLFRLLRAPEPAVAELRPLMEELSRLRPGERFPFLGLLPRLLEGSDPELRRLALGALGGATGRPAVERMVSALGDPDREVKLAAVEALRATAGRTPGRWVHALFHADPEVRRAAVSGDWPPGVSSLAFALLPDPATGPELLRRLDLDSADPDAASRPTLCPAALPAFFEHLASGLLEASTARRLASSLPWRSAEGWLGETTHRDETAVSALLDAAASAPPEPSPGEPADVLDLLFDLFWDDDPGSFLRSLLHSLGGTAVARRAAASLLAVGARRGSFPRGAAELLTILHPRFLGFPWVSVETRRAGSAELYAAPGTPPRLPDDEVRALLEADVCRRPGGGLDLFVVGAVLHLLENHPYNRVLRWLGAEVIVEAFLADVDHSIPFLSLRDESKRGRAYVLERITRAHPFGRGQLLALLTLASPTTALDFLEKLTAEEAEGMLVELLRMTARPGAAMSPRKTARVAELAALLGPEPARLSAMLAAWLRLEAPASSTLGLAALGAAAGVATTDGLTGVVAALPADDVATFLAALPHASTFPYGKELALAHALSGHADPRVAEWASARVPPAAEATSSPLAPAPPGAPAATLSEAQLDSIRSAPDAALEAAVAPCFARPAAGLTEALEKRSRPSAPMLKVCVALVGSLDPIDRVDAELCRFGAGDPAFASRLDREILRAWERTKELPLLAHAWLHRWERHAFAFARLLGPMGFSSGLRMGAALASPLLRASVWDAVASALAMWRWRDREAFERALEGDLGDTLVAHLDTDVGDAAARLLVTIAESGAAPALVERLRPLVERKLPDLAASTLALLSRWVTSRGLLGAMVRAARAAATEAALLDEVRTSTDPSKLAGHCAGSDARLAQEAAVRLIELGEPALGRLLDVVAGDPPSLRALAASLPLWPDGPTLDRCRALVASPQCSAAPRFYLALGLLERGERAALEPALAAAREETVEAWFQRDDWGRLLGFGMSEPDLALALAPSPHAHAYLRAVELLIALLEVEAPGAREALLAFLERGTKRLTSTRRAAARSLVRHGDDTGFPILLEERADPDVKDPPAVLDGVGPELVLSAVESVLLAGAPAVPERLVLDLLDEGSIDPAARAQGYERVLAEATTEGVRAAALTHVRHSPHRSQKLTELAQTFLWGLGVGRELTGRLFSIEAVAGEALGHTRLNESRIHVSPVPILTRAPDGREVVEGLILHELGHHLYHRGPDAEAAWETARKEGIFGLLNLVADEHLERNLRSRDASFGDRLKRLGAYAFQHADKEVPVAELCESLGARAFAVLSQTHLGVSRSERLVRVRSGIVLQQMERAGLSFSRFFRALRMGLGDRHGDPRVREGLTLTQGIRKRTMPELLELSRRLRDLFGWQARVLAHFGPHESLGGDAAEAAIHGEGITQEEIDAEVERVKNPEKRRAGADRKGSDRPWINVTPDDRFELIHNVVPVARDSAAHAAQAAQVLVASRQMRRWLEGLGARLEPKRFRLRGRRFDPSRALAVVTRGDPRMLVARELEIRTDLFLGVLVDCSSSMNTRRNIDKAKLFGTMLAEAARGVRGVDLRLFGFTDSTIYDAGDADHCAVHALEAGGGNNDAAALFHAARVARASRRKAKLLVMVSDGLPSECTVEALRALVTRLTTRHGICCAQVAVQPLAEVCFPNYVVLEGAEPGPLVRRFGAIIAGLVEKAMVLGG